MITIGLALLIAGGIILTAGDVIMKKWVVSNTTAFYVIGMVFYVLGLNFLAQSYKYRNIAVASTILVVINVVTLSLFSHFYFKDALSAYQIVGIILAISAVVFLEVI